MWLRIAFTDAITHVVHDRLLPSLVADMAARGHAIDDFEAKYGPDSAAALGGNPKVITDWALDIGGPCHTDRPMEEIGLDGLALFVPCEQFGPIVRAVHSARQRRFSSGDAYYKLKFWMHATVLTVEQYDTVLARLEFLRPGAEQRSFHEAIRRGQQVGVS